MKAFDKDLFAHFKLNKHFIANCSSMIQLTIDSSKNKSDYLFYNNVYEKK